MIVTILPTFPCKSLYYTVHKELREILNAFNNIVWEEFFVLGEASYAPKVSYKNYDGGYVSMYGPFVTLDSQIVILNHAVIYK